MKYYTINPINAYLDKVSPEKKPLAEEIRTMIRKSLPLLTECLKWDQPCYFFHGPVCSFDVHRNSVNIGFFKGKELNDPARLLTGKTMKHIKIRSSEELASHKETIVAMIREAVDLNASHVCEAAGAA